MPGLSVTIIAKNEAHNLPRALSSVASIANEIIVVDTGSTDGTLDIARAQGARVEQFVWVDDFSAAHNYANSLATCEWLLMLDADEEFLETSREALMACLTDPQALGYLVLRQDLVDAQRLDHYTEMWQLRLLRNRPDLKVKGRFHHQLDPAVSATAAAEGLAIRESTVRLRHYGYLPGTQQAKLERAARLLALELQDRPDQFYYLVELGLTQLDLGEAQGVPHLAQAAQQVVNDARVLDEHGGPLAMLLEYVLGCPELPADFPLSRAAALRLAVTRYPNAPPLVWQVAADCHRRGQFTECARLLEHLLKLSETHSYDHRVSFNPAILGDDARLNLGVCLLRMGQVKRAEQLFRRLRDSPHRGREAAANLKAIASLRRK